jgi:hypothetical protein
MSPRRLVLAGLSVFVTALVVAGTRSQWNLVDDALILCRFAENVGRGAGWGFNPGIPIDSQSSPLWLALLSVGERLSMDLPYLSRALGVLSALLLVVVVARAAGRLFPGGVALAVVLVVAGDAALATWALSGLETAGFSLLLVAGQLLLLAALRAPGASLDLLLGGVAGALALARPEGLLFGGLLVAVRLSAGGPGRGIATLAVFLVVAGALAAWRSAAFGSVVPGTLAAKWSPGAESLGAGFVAALHALARRAPLVVGALAALPLLHDHRTDPALRRFVLSSVLAVVGLFGIVVLAGGDWMGRDRLPNAAFPLLALLAGSALAIRGPAVPVAPPTLFFLAALSVAGSWWGADRMPEHGHAARRLGEWLSRHVPADTRLGVAAAGAVPFHSGLVTVDALGITDAAVAATPAAPRAEWRPGHMRYDLERFLDARPDVVVWEFGAAWARARMTEPSEGVPERRGDYRRELLRHPRFRAEYRPMPGVPAESERYFSVFRRRGGGAPETSGGSGATPGDGMPEVPQRTP